ncbi:hypothetical protein C8Q75DRAFT_735948 [Abortiporus biennis]|nr:hypothetical protein C8Q75DRAFT_735948 [Abortiporus biennis]
MHQLGSDANARIDVVWDLGPHRHKLIDQLESSFPEFRSTCGHSVTQFLHCPPHFVPRLSARLDRWAQQLFCIVIPTETRTFVDNDLIPNHLAKSDRDSSVLLKSYLTASSSITNSDYSTRCSCYDLINNYVVRFNILIVAHRKNIPLMTGGALRATSGRPSIYFFADYAMLIFAPYVGNM